MKLNAAGTGIEQVGNRDTTSYFQSRNRFRHVSVGPDGAIFVAIETGTTSSGPSASNPVVSTCQGCVQRYDFMGYLNNGGQSGIPESVPVGLGIGNTIQRLNDITITPDNDSLWIPITDTNSNVIAEVRPQRYNFGTIKSWVYKNAGAVRQDGNRRLYLDRNLTFEVENYPSGGIMDIRMYITEAEFLALRDAVNFSGNPSGVTTINNVGAFRNRDSSRATLLTTAVTQTLSAKGNFGTGYVLTASNVPFNASTGKMASFYFGNIGNTTLPTNLISFNGYLNSNKVDLNWVTASEVNAEKFIIERSTDGSSFSEIGTTQPSNGSGNSSYTFTDFNVLNQSSQVLYYRLKIVDKDGQFIYSGQVPVTLAAITGKLVVNPNPVKDLANVTLTAVGNGKAIWILLDASGRSVLQGSLDLKKGNNYFPLNVSSQAAGMYLLKVKGEGIDQQVKFQKQ